MKLHIPKHYRYMVDARGEQLRNELRKLRRDVVKSRPNKYVLDVDQDFETRLKQLEAARAAGL